MHAATIVTRKGGDAVMVALAALRLERDRAERGAAPICAIGKRA